MKSKKKTVSNGNQITRRVVLRGLRPLMFDRFGGSIEPDAQLLPEEKIYVSSENPRNLIFPSSNLMSFLSAQNTESAPKRVIKGRGAWQKVAKAALSFIDIDPIEIPIMREGVQATVDDIHIDVRKAIVLKGKLAIPSPKERPVLDRPWSLEFQVTLYKNPDLAEEVLLRLFEEGGIQIGIGTYRGIFGKFEVETWE